MEAEREWSVVVLRKTGDRGSVGKGSGIPGVLDRVDHLYYLIGYQPFRI